MPPVGINVFRGHILRSRHYFVDDVSETLVLFRRHYLNGPCYQQGASRSRRCGGSLKRGRHEIARTFMEQFGGDNSSRLLLGGLLSDLSAEHYSWVATGGQATTTPTC